MCGGHGMVTLAHFLGKPIHLAASVGENDRLGDGQGLVQITKGVQLPLLLLHIDVELLDTLQGQLITLHKNAHGLVHELPGDLKRLWGQSGAEYAHLQLRGQQLEDVINLVLEPTGQHLIGFIQHKHLDGVRTQVAATKHVIHTPRGAHHSVHTITQDASVLTHTGATHACVALHLQVVSKSTHDLLDLLSQLTSGSKHQSLTLAQVVVQVVQNARAEGGGLARA
mmetsp:Transcript_12945/g.22833  ORF Transcript_12945/g.22833 Transcript_12945/m.22833 type:complete len:225 (-) Transcript_12945:375-1049(-)